MTAFAYAQFDENNAYIIGAMTHTIEEFQKELRFFANKPDLDYMTPGQLRKLSMLSHSAEGAHYILKLVQGNRSTPERFLEKLDDLMDMFVAEELDVAAIHLLLNVQKTYSSVRSALEA
jgi:hypothetical protein